MRADHRQARKTLKHPGERLRLGVDHRGGEGVKPHVKGDGQFQLDQGFVDGEKAFLPQKKVLKIRMQLDSVQPERPDAVQFRDGGVKAQLGVPDMRLPIQYAFSFPERLPLNGDRLDLFRQPLEFFEPDMEKFRCLAMAYESIRRGGNVPCVVNAANEVVNEAFRHDRCGFLQMADIIEATMQRATFVAQPTYDDYIASDAEARRIAASML